MREGAGIRVGNGAGLVEDIQVGEGVPQRGDGWGFDGNQERPAKPFFVFSLLFFSVFL